MMLFLDNRQFFGVPIAVTVPRNRFFSLPETLEELSSDMKSYGPVVHKWWPCDNRRVRGLVWEIRRLIFLL